MSDRSGDVLVRSNVEDRFTLPVGLNDARGTQETQVVADKRPAQLVSPDFVVDGHRTFEAGQDDAQPRRIAEQAEQICKLGHRIVGSRDRH